MEPILIDENGEWYSMKGMSKKMQRTPERIRQLALSENPPIIKDKSRGIILYCLAKGWEFCEDGGIKERV